MARKGLAVARSVRTKQKSKKTLKAKKNQPKLRVVQRPETIEKMIIEHRESGRKLARSILRGWRVRMPAEEIDSIVDLSLCESARRYSPKHGASYMTFMFYHLRGNLVRAVASAAKMNNFVVAFAQNAGIDIGEWASTNDNNAWAQLPDYGVFEHRDIDLPEQILIRREKIQSTRSACSRLDTLEQEVLHRSYSNDEALIDIARELGYSRCHISRVKKRALDRLKEVLTTSSPEVIPVGGSEDHDTVVSLDSVRNAKRRSRRRRIQSTTQGQVNGQVLTEERQLAVA